MNTPLGFSRAVREFGDDWRLRSFLALPEGSRNGDHGTAILLSNYESNGDVSDGLIMDRRMRQGRRPPEAA